MQYNQPPAPFYTPSPAAGHMFYHQPHPYAMTMGIPRPHLPIQQSPVMQQFGTGMLPGVYRTQLPHKPQYSPHHVFPSYHPIINSNAAPHAGPPALSKMTATPPRV